MAQANRGRRKRRYGVTRRAIMAIAFAVQVSAAAAQTSSAEQIIARTHAAFRAARSASVVDSLETLCQANLSLIFLPKRDRLVVEAIEFIHQNKFKEANDAFLRIGDLESELDSRKKACRPSPEEALRATTPRDDAGAAAPQASAQERSPSDAPALPTEAASSALSQNPASAIKGETAKPAPDRDSGAAREISSSVSSRPASTAEPSAVSRQEIAEEAKADPMPPPRDAPRPAASVAEEHPMAASSLQPAAAPKPAPSLAGGPDGERSLRRHGPYDPSNDFTYLPPPEDSAPQRPPASPPQASSAPPTRSAQDSAASPQRAPLEATPPFGSGFGENAPPPSAAASAASAPIPAPGVDAAPVRPAATRDDFAQIETRRAASVSPSPAEPSAEASTRLEPPPEIVPPQKHAQLASDRSAASPVAASQTSPADAPSPTFAMQEAKPPQGDAAPAAPAKLSSPMAPPRATTGPDGPSPQNENASEKSFAADERNSTTGSPSSPPPAAALLEFSNQPPETASAAESEQGASVLARPQGAAGENARTGSPPSQAAAPAALTKAVPQAEVAGKLPMDGAPQRAATEKLAAAPSILSSKASAADSPVLATPPLTQPTEAAAIDKRELDRPPLPAGQPSEATRLAGLRGVAAEVARAFTTLSASAATRLSQAASQTARALIEASESESPAERASTREAPAPALSAPDKDEASTAATGKIARPLERSARERTASAAAEDKMSMMQDRANSSLARPEETRRPRAASRASRAAASHAPRTPSPAATPTAKVAVGARMIDRPEDTRLSTERYRQAAAKKANSVPGRARLAASQGHEPSAIPGMVRRRCPTILASDGEYDDELVSFCAQWANAIE